MKKNVKKHREFCCCYLKCKHNTLTQTQTGLWWVKPLTVQIAHILCVYTVSGGAESCQGSKKVHIFIPFNPYHWVIICCPASFFKLKLCVIIWKGRAGEIMQLLLMFCWKWPLAQIQCCKLWGALSSTFCIVFFFFFYTYRFNSCGCVPTLVNKDSAHSLGVMVQLGVMKLGLSTMHTLLLALCNWKCGIGQ